MAAMKNHIYRVEFITKKHGCKHWAIDIEADSQNEAKETAKAMWSKAILFSTMHMFSITARALSDNEELEYNYFKRIGP